MVTDLIQLDRVFAALSDPTRRSTLVRLTRGPAFVGELAAPHRLSPAGFSKHLKVLQDAGLVEKELDGRRHRCKLRPAGLRAAAKWLGLYERFWSDALDGLEQFLKPGSAGATDE